MLRPLNERQTFVMTTESVSLARLNGWIGHTECRSDTLTAAPLTGLSATLNRTDDPDPNYGTDLPPLAHWLFFLPQAAQSEIGVDGHPKRGGFLPPVPLPRRMWAGGRLRFTHSLHVGDNAERHSTITRVDSKEGRSGALVFVTVRHEVSDARGVALTEEQDIVYRDNPEPGAASPTPPTAATDEDFRRVISPDPVMLFRYSALTFNGHRIHYDRPYATEVEGYPGLVVHAPLIATLLVDLVRRELPHARINAFEFKAVSPLFDIHPLTVGGKCCSDRHITLWASNHLGQLAMQAHAELG